MSAGLLLAIAAFGGPGTACLTPMAIPAGTAIPLATTAPLSSQTAATGDIIALVTSDDIRIAGETVIPKGTPATGQVSESRATGGFGVDGRLSLRPLYLRLGDRIVRLSGSSIKDGGVNAGQVAGLVMLTPVFSGRRSIVPAGTPVPATVAKAVTLSGPPRAGC